MAATAAPAKRSRAKTKEPSVLVAPDDFHRISKDICTTTLVERDVAVRLFILAMLAGGNIHFLGEPGVSKSLLVRELGKRLLMADGSQATVFEKAMNEEIGSSELLGQVDVARLMGDPPVFARHVEAMIPTALLVFVDELTRSGRVAKNVLLPVMNTGERHVEINGVTVKAAMLCFASASNHAVDPDDPNAQAFLDRMGLIYTTERIRLDDNFKEMLLRAGARNRQNGTFKREHMTVEQVHQAQRQVTMIDDTPEFLDAITRLRATCMGEGLFVSDRKWVEIHQICRAGAWLAGRDHLVAEDVANSEFALARDPADQPKAHALVMPFQGRFEREAAAKRQEAADPIARWQAVRPRVESTPPTEEMDPDVLKEVISVRRRIEECARRTGELIVEADKESREAPDLRALANELTAIQRWFDRMNLTIGVRR